VNVVNATPKPKQTPGQKYVFLVNQWLVYFSDPILEHYVKLSDMRCGLTADARNSASDRYIEHMTQTPQEEDWQLRAKRRASRWAQLFAVIGAVLVPVYAALISLYDIDLRALEPFVFPASFVLFVGDWRGEFGPAVLLATAANAAAWAGIGWILGYGSSR
jgi:hypothetical protein